MDPVPIRNESLPNPVALELVAGDAILLTLQGLELAVSRRSLLSYRSGLTRVQRSGRNGVLSIPL